MQLVINIWEQVNAVKSWFEFEILYKGYFNYFMEDMEIAWTSKLKKKILFV